MGLAASQARLLMLTARKSDIELQMQFINQARLQLANMVSALFMKQSQPNLNPGSPDAQRINAAQADLQTKDKRFEIMSKQLDTQHQAVQTEVESVQKVIQKNIEMDFKMMG
jgi:chaperonin cofactor prefoldin